MYPFVYFGTRLPPPHQVTVTTRIIPFLVGNPYKPSFVTVTGWGGRPNVYRVLGENTVWESLTSLDDH